MVGTVVDTYRIEEVLGAGGMGVVYKAVDTSLDKIVALKVMNPRLKEDDRFLRRFKAEARALGRLQHPHIVNVFAFRQAAPFLLIVTEYIEGGTLTALIKRCGPLPWQAAAPIMRQTLGAIAYAHRQQIIHRDIKPGNILLTQAGAVKVTDFGLAKIQTASPDSLGATSAEFVAGTLYYMPPEQLEGLANVDQRGDVYALGMTFYEMLAGRTPFARLGSNFAVQKAIDAHDFPSLDQLNKDVPPPLVQIITKAIEREPSDRYASAEAMLAALEAWQEPTSLHAAGTAGSVAYLRHVASPATPEGGLPRLFMRRPVKTELLHAITETQRPATRRSQQGSHGRYAPRSIRLLASLMGAMLLVSVLFNLDAKSRVEPPPGKDDAAQLGPASVEEKHQPVVPEDAPPMALVHTDVDQPSSPASSAQPVHKAQRTEDKTDVPAALPPSLPANAIAATVTFSSLDTPAGETTVPSDAGEAQDQRPIGPDSSTAAVASGVDTRALGRGTLRVKPIPWGNVYVDGVPHGYEINYLYTLSLSAHSHRITVRNPVLGRTWTSDVVLAPGDTQDVVIDFMARVDVNVAAKDTEGHPISGEIYVDGNPTGDWSPIKIEVYPGLHRIEVRRAGYTQLELREARGEASLPLENPVQFNQSHQARIVHAILKQTLED